MRASRLRYFGMAITQEKPPSHALPPPRENSDGVLRPPSSFGPRKRSDGGGVAASGAEESRLTVPLFHQNST
jgi:hypothetical protein